MAVGAWARWRERPRISRNPATREPGIRLQRAIFETVDEVGRVVAQEGIDCHWAKGGMLNLATAPAHEAILHAEVAHWAELGFGEKDWLWLDRDAVTEHIRSPRVSAALYSPHCAAIHPLRLATGLAKVVQGLGVEIYGETPATRVEKGSVLTPRGRVRADRVVLATEAYTDSIAGRKRQMLALHSMMIATEPLSAQTWEEIGLGARQTFGDPRRTVIYGQRTADDRIAFGTRGGYFFGSRTRSRFAPDERFFIQARKNLWELFPVLEDAEVTHSWGGALGVPRNWRPSVGMDRRAGLAWAGGYVGEGVAASNLGGAIRRRPDPRKEFAPGRIALGVRWLREVGTRTPALAGRDGDGCLGGAIGSGRIRRPPPAPGAEFPLRLDRQEVGHSGLEW